MNINEKFGILTKKLNDALAKKCTKPVGRLCRLHFLVQFLSVALAKIPTLLNVIHKFSY